MIKNTIALIALTLASSVLSFSQRQQPPTDEILRLCVAEAVTRKFEAALNDCTAAINKFPQRFEAYQARGMANLGLKKNDAALADITKAVELAPNNFEAIGIRGEIYAATQKLDLPLADFNKVLLLAPNYPVALFRRSQIYALTGKKDLAIADLNAILARNPNQPDAKAALAQLLPAKAERYSSDKFKVAFQLPGDSEKLPRSTETRHEYFGDKMKFNLSSLSFDIKESKEASDLSRLLSTDAGTESIANNLIQQFKSNLANPEFALLEKKRVQIGGRNGLKIVFTKVTFAQKVRHSVFVVPVPEHGRYYEFWITAYDEYFDKWFANAETAIRSFEVLMP